MGIEPTTTRLKGARSTDWAKSAVRNVLYWFHWVLTRSTTELPMTLPLGGDRTRDHAFIVGRKDVAVWNHFVFYGHLPNAPGRNRTADISINSRTLWPTELPELPELYERTENFSLDNYDWRVCWLFSLNLLWYLELSPFTIYIIAISLSCFGQKNTLHHRLSFRKNKF